MTFRTNIIITVALVAGVALSACSRPTKVPANHDVTIKRLDYAIEESDTMSGVRADSLTGEFSAGIDALGFIYGFFPDASSGAEGFRALRNDASLAFTPAVRERADNLREVERSLTVVREKMARVLPDVAFPEEIYAVEWPYSQSMAIVNDTVLLIAMNHYLGADFDGYEGFETYRRRHKSLDRLPYDVAEAVIRTRYPFPSEEGANVLSRLIYEGAVAQAVADVVPGADQSSALGYDGDEMAWARRHEAKSWNSIVAGGQLFSTSQVDMARLVDPSPATASVHPDAPGRLGRYIGMRIVEALRNNDPGVSPGRILSEKMYTDDDVLLKSKYAPR